MFGLSLKVLVLIFYGIHPMIYIIHITVRGGTGGVNQVSEQVRLMSSLPELTPH